MIILNPTKCSELFEEMRATMKIVAVSGYFDPPTPAHLKYFKAAKALGDVLVVILNNDKQLQQKRFGTSLEGKIRYPFNDRAHLINDNKYVDFVVKSVDIDNGIGETIKLIRPHIFAKGGDRNTSNIPKQELEVCKEIGCEIVNGVGGEKTHSSSWYDWE
jgi:D-beta-D-heptose 7-phosphate kinase/D-beta-D-heptose 1-phosphate adenosyltransferase